MKRTRLFILALCACLMVGTHVRAIEMLPTFGDIDHIHLPALIAKNHKS